MRWGTGGGGRSEGSEMRSRVLAGKREGKRRFEDIDGRIILKWIL
jgi:hypothetical protein